jgi:hypothetical protein
MATDVAYEEKAVEIAQQALDAAQTKYDEEFAMKQIHYAQLLKYDADRSDYSIKAGDAITRYNKTVEDSKTVSNPAERIAMADLALAANADYEAAQYQSNMANTMKQRSFANMKTCDHYCVKYRAMIDSLTITLVQAQAQARTKAALASIAELTPIPNATTCSGTHSCTSASTLAEAPAPAPAPALSPAIVVGHEEEMSPPAASAAPDVVVAPAIAKALSKQDRLHEINVKFAMQLAELNATMLTYITKFNSDIAAAFSKDAM